MQEINIIEAVRQAMYEEMDRDKSVFILGEDIGVRGGVFLATDGFLEAFGAQRVIDTPISESAIAGIALGAAMQGMKPIVEIEFADFIWPVFNQILGEAARLRYGTEGKLQAPLVLRAPYGGGIRGGLYHSQSPEVHFAHTPGLKVVAPATPYDAKGLLKTSIRDNDPVIFLEHKKTYRLVKGNVPTEVIIDSWYNYSERFEYLNHNWERILPDTLTVCDNIAYKIVLNQKLNKLCKIQKQMFTDKMISSWGVNFNIF